MSLMCNERFPHSMAGIIAVYGLVVSVLIVGNSGFAGVPYV